MSRTGCGPTGCLLVLALLSGVASVGYYTVRTDTQECTVVSKDRTTGRDGKSSMRVYTDECGVLEVSDVWWRLEFGSADTYSSLREGNKYKILTTGFRVPFLSVFPKILEAKEVNP